MQGNQVAELVLATFRTLPSKAKPRHYLNGLREWTPLSGLVISNVDSSNARCVALG